MTHLDVVRRTFVFPNHPVSGDPLEPRQFQADNLNTYGLDDRHGFYWQPGTGKTFGTTLHMLRMMLSEDVRTWVITMPPVLIPQWKRFLQGFYDKRSNQYIKASAYVSNPSVTGRGASRKSRQLVDLNVPFILMSYDMFKLDFEYLWDKLRGRGLGGTCDEGHAIKNPASVNHRAHREMYEGLPFYIATGTPVTSPVDSFGYCRFTNPTAYTTITKFMNLHAAKKDERDNVIEWKNLELMKKNFDYRSSRILKADHLDLPPVTYNPIFYDLSPAHKAFYNRVAEERLVELENGGIVDAISTSKLYATLQQLILNWAYFAQDPDLTPEGLELLDAVVDELGGRKLVVSANYRLTNELVRKRYPKAAYVYGGMTDSARSGNVERFINDPSCTMIVLQPVAAGQGTDGLQHVCSDLLMLECPGTPREFEQVVSRLDRDGQKEPVSVRIAVAQRTLQVRRHKDLLKKDELANAVQGNIQNLREAIYGD